MSWVAAHHQRVLTFLPSKNVKLLHFDIDKHGTWLARCCFVMLVIDITGWVGSCQRARRAVV